MGRAGTNHIDPSATRRVLFTRIAACASDGDVRRAERLLLRAIERRWPAARIEGLLRRLLAAAPVAAMKVQPR